MAHLRKRFPQFCGGGIGKKILLKASPFAEQNIRRSLVNCHALFQVKLPFVQQETDTRKTNALADVTPIMAGDLETQVNALTEEAELQPADFNLGLLRRQISLRASRSTS
jgi:hypothetical protein